MVKQRDNMVRVNRGSIRREGENKIKSQSSRELETILRNVHCGTYKIEAVARSNSPVGWIWPEHKVLPPRIQVPLDQKIKVVLGGRWWLLPQDFIPNTRDRVVHPLLEFLLFSFTLLGHFLLSFLGDT